LKWSDPVVKYLPEFELYDSYLTKDIRIDDLLSHRTGLETTFSPIAVIMIVPRFCGGCDFSNPSHPSEVATATTTSWL
jgi:Beta-lactamase